MKPGLMLIVSLMTLASTAYSQDTHMICLTKDYYDMDVKVTGLGNRNEQLSIIIMSMSGDHTHTYVNSDFKDLSLTKSLELGVKIEAVVSKANVLNQTGKAEIVYNPATNRYDVTFTIEGYVYTGACR